MRGALRATSVVVPVENEGGGRCTVVWRPLWRWARLEQMFVGARMEGTVYDWDLLRSAAPAMPPGQPAVGLPPAGWVGMGHPEPGSGGEGAAL